MITFRKQQQPVRQSHFSSLLKKCTPGLLFLFLLLLERPAMAQYDGGIQDPHHGVTLTSGDLAVGHTATVDYSTFTQQSTQVNQKIQNIIWFKILEETPRFIPEDFNAEVELQIEFGPDANNLSTTQKTLKVNYKKDGGNTYDAVSYFAFADAKFVRITILSFGSRGGGSLSLNEVLSLENEMKITRYFELPSSVPAPTLGHNVSTTAPVPDQLTINWSWPANTGNNATQLEWVWIENELDNNYKINGQLNEGLMFNNNSTRVDIPLDKTSYSIPLLYDGTGKLYYRIRAVNIKPDGNRSEGPWTAAVSGNHYYGFNGHNPDLNWQATTSFAEEGKLKSVVQYYDGSLRLRQTVTKDNTNNTVITAETFYDYQGRAAIQILPTPGISGVLQYRANLNLFNGQQQDQDPAEIFDLQPAATPSSITPPLSTTTGSSWYYSEENPEKNTDKGKTIPNAGGYPYTVTRFTPDATGRILSQSGVGPDHQMGSGHETKYYYGTPSQEELDGLFGTEVGHFSHYFKNMVKDANGQVSVSYVDITGKTIATALAGDAPANLLPLNRDNNQHYPNQNGTEITRNLLDNGANVIIGNSIESVNSILTPTPTTYNFRYDLDPKILETAACEGATPAQLCYDCLYDLEISITDESGEHNEPLMVRKYTNISFGGTAGPDDNCNTPQAPLGIIPGNDATSADITGNSIQFSTTLPIGSYAIRKTLTINTTAFEFYKNLYITKALCKSEQEIIDSIYNELVLVTDCKNGHDITSQDCINALGTFEYYRNRYLQSLNIPLAEASPELLAEIQHSYDDALANCHLMSGDESQAMPGIREMMLTDMVPFTGQYAAETAPTTGSTTMYYKYNIFASTTPPGNRQPFYRHPFKNNTLDYYYDENGNIDPVAHPDLSTGHQYDYLNSLSPQGFESIFKQSWANALLPHHPEYQRLIYAETTLQPSYTWMNTFSLTDDWQTAVSQGYLSTTAAPDPASQDPYFTVVPGDLTDMHGTMGNYSHTGISMWQVAYGDVKCKDIVNTSQRQACYQAAPTLFPQGLTTDAEKKQAWQAYRSLYMAERMRFVNKHIANHAPLPNNDEADLVSQGYRLWFPRDEQQAATQNGWLSWWPNPSPGSTPPGSPTGGSTSPTATYTTRCDSYISQWKNKLLQCDALANNPNKDAILTEITTRMKTVCINGSNEANPYGASNVAPGTPATVTDRSFEDVIKSVFIQYGIIGTNGKYTDNYCNPFVIEWPKAYGTGPDMVGGQVTIKLDSCNCHQYAIIKNAATAQGYNVNSLSSINQFLVNNQYSETLTAETFEALKKCNDTIIVTCHYVDSTFTYDSCKGPYPPCVLSLQNKQANETNLFASGTEETNMSVPYACPSLEYVTHLFNQQYNGANNFPVDMVVTTRTNNLPLEYVASNSITFMPGFESGVNDQFVAYISNFTGDCHTAFVNFFNYYFNLHPPRSWEDIYKIYMGYCGHGPRICEDSTSDCIKTIHCQVKVCDTIHQGGVFYLAQPVPFPNFLKCGYEHHPRCVSCANLSALTSEYKTIFTPNVNTAPVFSGTNLTPEQVGYNMNYARFLNYRTGFQFGWLDYSQAAAHATPACNLQNYGSNSNATQTVICGNTKPLTDTTGLPLDTLCHSTRIISIVKGQQIYQLRKLYLLAAFEKAYKEKCLASADIESFTVGYLNSEYHYTLYYYDQAGNLVKTVPPAGVRPDFSKNFTDQVKAARDAGTELPRQHELITQYRYNSLNQVIAQQTPDAGISHFWYDELGRLVVSQNAQQAIDGNYSYTLYDDLGRIKEVGQKPQSTPMDQTISQNRQQLHDWIFDGNNNKEQITRTTYDVEAPNLLAAGISLLTQHYLRNRVSYSQYFDQDPDASTDQFDHNSATYYSYDVHGNVEVLLQDYKKGMGEVNCDQNGNGGNRFKKMTYNYDLISGKVNQVNYQPGAVDAFYHRYFYDAENRLTDVFTSRDQLYWEKDAAYKYYDYGPLARTELGQQKVQGIDYAYTIHGWLKGINSTSVHEGLFDIGQDGKIGSVNSNTARDAYGFSLNYFENDYNAISGQTIFNANSFSLTDFDGREVARPLYNGNIAGMFVTIPKLGERDDSYPSLYYGYQYDQLNRIRGMGSFTRFDNTENQWKDFPQALKDYNEATTYDPNGNIETYTRNGTESAGNQLQMDDLQYEYITNTNKLKRVTDNVADGNYSEDIDNQTDPDNYHYDAIGNLISDNAEGISSITWTVYGKIASISKGRKLITYTYDVAGNRISKSIREGRALSSQTFYVRDASGNVMSVYNRKLAGDGILYQDEVNLYGSSRIGVYNVKTDVQNCLSDPPQIRTFTRGQKFFELTNHLGNVLVTISDRKLQVEGEYCPYCPPNTICPACEPNGGIAYYLPDIVTANDYYPFGMLMPGRKFDGGSGYRYGFNGKEKSDEFYGEGNVYDYGFRIYNPRLGRFLSIDPLFKTFPWYTPYQFAGNSPSIFIDLDGCERNYYRYKTGKDGTPVLVGFISQTNEPTIIQDIWNSGGDRYFPAQSHPYDRKTTYHGDLITDCSEVYVLDDKFEFPSFEELKKASTADLENAAAEATDQMVYMAFYTDMAVQYYTMPSDFYDAVGGGGEYWDPFSDNKFNRYCPELYPELHPRYDGIKVTESVGAETTISGSSLVVGSGELNNGVLTTAIYLKDGKTGEYLLKKGTVTGSDVFDHIFKGVKSQGGVINIIQGYWVSGDNLSEFNSLIMKGGLTPEAAASQTFTGQQAAKRGYTKASIDQAQSKQNKDGTYSKVVVNFTQ